MQTQSTSKVLPVIPETRSDLRRLTTQGQTLSFRRPFIDILADLSKPLPWAFINWLEKKDKKSGKLNYIPYLHWYDCNLILDYISPGWTGQLIHMPQGSRYVLGYEITLLCEEGPISRASTGDEALEGTQFGSSNTNSESQAFRRACCRFGLGLYLYDPSVKRALISRHVKEKGS
ncbi:hypothetical protein H6G00_01265 [Leptolyngbya sp. FACHB-541]|uniref:hypothetical protein n=1 Tax=Leptolyngbya sp. FACHB-541 TaxID=2692810 RepID=UPI0016887DEF|nr:hypothetical protein [Leptolyngbya sp. FACHB-541]MBD1995259.1 hypothetical protein [Leptolyngbya sp. FACHB-541]